MAVTNEQLLKALAVAVAVAAVTVAVLGPADGGEGEAAAPPSASAASGSGATAAPPTRIVFATGDAVRQGEPHRLRDADGVWNTCFVPSATSPGGGKGGAGGEMPSAAEVVELLGVLEDTCLYKLDGWWTYEFCYNLHLRQYHKDSKKLDEFILGRRLSDDSDAGRVERTGSKPDSPLSFVVTYNHGTPCDIETVVRSTAIRFVCALDAPGAMIRSIVEPATCTYEMIVAAPSLCAHPAFVQERAPTTVIECVPDKPAPLPGTPAAETGSAEAYVRQVARESL